MDVTLARAVAMHYRLLGDIKCRGICYTDECWLGSGTGARCGAPKQIKDFIRFEYFVSTVIISQGHILHRLISSGIGSYGVLITGFDRKPIRRDFGSVCVNHTFAVGRT